MGLKFPCFSLFKDVKGCELGHEQRITGKKECNPVLKDGNQNTRVQLSPPPPKILCIYPDFRQNTWDF